MGQIEGEIVIARPADVVFDYAADQRNEPDYNPRMVRSEKATGDSDEHEAAAGCVRAKGPSHPGTARRTWYRPDSPGEGDQRRVNQGRCALTGNR